VADITREIFRDIEDANRTRRKRSPGNADGDVVATLHIQSLSRHAKSGDLSPRTATNRDGKLWGETAYAAAAIEKERAIMPTNARMQLEEATNNRFQYYGRRCLSPSEWSNDKEKQKEEASNIAHR